MALKNSLDKKYTHLLQDILDNGIGKEDRTGTGTISVFSREIRHDMSEGFPLLTTKKMAWKSIVVELLWFLKGDTNIKYLVDNGCNIWNGDAYKFYCNHKDTVGPLTIKQFIDEIKTNEDFAKKWGDLGPIYGKQWRKWEATTNDEQPPNFENTETYIDQIADLIKDLKEDPDSRRLIVTAWNPTDVPKMTLPPCHYTFQCYTREIPYKKRYDMWFNMNYKTGMERNYYVTPDFDNEYYTPTPKRYLSLKWNQRSVDTFLGLPFNIASYGLLLQILAQHVNMIPDELIGSLGDTHLYSNHLEQAKIQIGMEWYELPQITIKDFNSIDDLTFEHFELMNYVSHGEIKAPLSN